MDMFCFLGDRKRNFASLKKIISLIFIFTLGCNIPDKKIHIKPQTIKELSAFNFDLPSPDIALFIFVRSSDDRHMARLNIIALHKIYTLAYSHNGTGFETFLSGALNETISIDQNILTKRGERIFMIDKEIKHDFDSLTFPDFENKYCEKRNNGQLAIKRKFNAAEGIDSILYYFFINNYKVVPDDYSGGYIVILPSS